MNTPTSSTFLSLKAIAFLTVAATSVALITPKFVHADSGPTPPAASALVTATPLPANEQPLSTTPASTHYYDGINVAVIAVAAYDN